MPYKKCVFVLSFILRYLVLATLAQRGADFIFAREFSVYSMSRPRPKTRPDTTHDHGQQLASMSGTAQPSHSAW